MSRLTALRLEAPTATGNVFDDANLLRSLSCLVSLVKLHFNKLSKLKYHSEDLAAALQPLRSLRALVSQDEHSKHCVQGIVEL